MSQKLFMGVRLSVPTAFGLLATSFPFAQISIGEAGIELLARLPLRSEWYSTLEEVALVQVDQRTILFARMDGSTAWARIFTRSHGAVVSALEGCGLQVEHVEQVAWG